MAASPPALPDISLPHPSGHYGCIPSLIYPSFIPKARLRREATEERRRAIKSTLELQKASRLLEHKQNDTKALKSALKNRDSQLAATGERIKELEDALAR